VPSENKRSMDIAQADCAPTISESALTEHAEIIRQYGKRVIADVIEIGRRLVECRRILKEDSGWRAWLEDELKWSPQTAGRFIQVYELSQECSTVEHLDLPVSALYLLAAPSTPAEVRDEIIERVESGEEVTVPEVRQTIEAAKPARKPRKEPAVRGITSPAPKKINPETAIIIANGQIAKLKGEIADLKAALTTNKQQLAMAQKALAKRPEPDFTKEEAGERHEGASTACQLVSRVISALKRMPAPGMQAKLNSVQSYVADREPIGWLKNSRK
jgi:hypothetical protein